MFHRLAMITTAEMSNNRFATLKKQFKWHCLADMKDMILLFNFWKESIKFPVRSFWMRHKHQVLHH